MNEYWIIEYKFGNKRQVDETITVAQPDHLSLTNVKSNATRLAEHLKGNTKTWGVQKITIYYYKSYSDKKYSKIQVSSKLAMSRFWNDVSDWEEWVY